MASSWFSQVTGATPRRLLVGVTTLLASAACIVVVSLGNARAVGELERAKARRAAMAEQKAKICIAEVVGSQPGQLAAAQRWIEVRSATFPENCLQPADRATFEQLTKRLQSLPVTDVSWADALEQRDLIILRGDRASVSDGAK